MIGNPRLHNKVDSQFWNTQPSHNVSLTFFSKKPRVVTKVVNVGDPTRAHLDGHDHDGHEN